MNGVTMPWKRAFSTLGCPGESLDEIGRLAYEHAIAGIELRVGLEAPPAVDEIVALLPRFGVTVFCIASSVRIADPAADAGNDLYEAVRTAIAVGAEFVRVFPGGTSFATALTNIDTVSDLLDQPGAPTIAIETHDAITRGRDLAALVARIGHPRLGAVWDVLHTWRSGESVDDSASALLGLPGYVQVKDVRSIHDLTPCLLGEGVLPLDAVSTALVQHEYRGWVSIEWERAWFPEIPALTQVLAHSTHW